MTQRDAETEARIRRVQDLCAQLARLVSASAEQRRSIDRLLTELETITRQLDRLPLTMAAGQSRPLAQHSSD